MHLRVLTKDEWAVFREVRLEALREAPGAFRTVLGQGQGDGDTERRWRQRLTEVPFNVVAYVDNVPAGMVSATKPSADGEIELISMWVAPFARGKMVADALVDAVIRRAREQHIRSVTLDVMEDNERARALYRRRGFVDRGRIEGAPETHPERRMRLEL